MLEFFLRCFVFFFIVLLFDGLNNDCFYLWFVVD
nr:MAG TPA: hypothetical protein [Inoviridae sp.]